MKMALHMVTTYQAGVVQASVNRLLQKRCDELLEPYGLTKNQWLIIGTVYDAGNSGILISELAVILGTTLPYLTNTINLLESKGILQREVDSQDNRSKHVRISRKFRAKVKHIEAALRRGLRQTIYSHIDSDEFAIYMKVLYRLHGIE